MATNIEKLHAYLMASMELSLETMDMDLLLPDDYAMHTQRWHEAIRSAIEGEGLEAPNAEELDHLVEQIIESPDFYCTVEQGSAYHLPQGTITSFALGEHEESITPSDWNMTEEEVVETLNNESEWYVTKVGGQLFAYYYLGDTAIHYQLDAPMLADELEDYRETATA